MKLRGRPESGGGVRGKRRRGKHYILSKDKIENNKHDRRLNSYMGKLTMGDRLSFSPSGITCAFQFSILNLSLTSLGTGKSPEEIICSFLSCELLLTLPSASDALRGNAESHRLVFPERKHLVANFSGSVTPSLPVQPNHTDVPTPLLFQRQHIVFHSSILLSSCLC